VGADHARVGHVLDGLEAAGLRRENVIVRLSDGQRQLVAERAAALTRSRRRDILRCGAMRLHELDALGVAVDGGWCGTTTNGTYVPATIPLDDRFWHVVGLYLAEGHVGRDGARCRLAWSFHPTAEPELVDAVASFWRDVGMKVSVRTMTTTRQVSISSRILAAWFTDVLGLGHNCYTKRLPDEAWSLPEPAKRALLRGLWDGDGSWSKVAGGPSVVLEYGTVSPALADGMLRLLGDVGIAARLRVGRCSKSTVDAYWINIAGADQIEAARWLLPEEEQRQVLRSIEGQAKRIAPTGYRRLSKHAAWVRVTGIAPIPHNGTVYSLEVPAAGTVVTTNGLVAHNCFPKDTRALIRIAEEAGYDFGLLRGVIGVNEEQYERVTSKIVAQAGGSVDGRTIAVWGLTFKARTDDLRESPSLEIIRRLRERGATVQAFDPAVSTAIEGIDLRSDPYAACEGAVVLTVLTEWDEFRWLDFEKVKGLLAEPNVMDARNLLDPAALRRRGFNYQGIGR
jgi:UDPglucose 6-dehydrogenase